MTLYAAPDEEDLDPIATSTFADLKARVVADRVDATSYDARVGSWLNEAQGRIARRVKIERLRARDTVAVTAGDTAYNLPDDYTSAIDLVHTDAFPFPLTDEKDEKRFDRLPPLTGRPARYLVTEGRLYIWPTPDQAYELRLRYQRVPARMVEDDDVPEIPEDYVDSLVEYATARVQRNEDDPDIGAKWMADFENTVSTMKVNLQESSQDGPIQIGGTFP